jgi:2-polyprenyl-6-methoxyphenol hydroxylase-like FAD-dependent oxidoreductase
LLAGLDDRVHFDKSFSRYEESPDGRVTAFFEDGTSAAGDVLVGADGGNSRVRRQFLPHADRVDTGIRAIGGKVILTDRTRSRLSSALFEGPTLVRAPGGCAMFLAAHEVARPTEPDAETGGNGPSTDLHPRLLPDESESYLMWAVSGHRERAGFPPDPGSLDGSALWEFASRVCAGWNPAFAEMIRLTDPGTLSLIKIRTSTPVAPWRTGRITLIGDAIHSMTPYRGIGGNVALRDASLLCQMLAAAARGESDLLQAIHRYEADMIEYGFKAVRSSLQAAEMAHSDSAFARVTSNAMFRIVNAVPSLKARMFARSADD